MPIRHPPDNLTKEEMRRMVLQLEDVMPRQHITHLLEVTQREFEMGRYRDRADQWIEKWAEEQMQRADPLERRGYRKTTPPKSSGFLRCETCKDTDWMVVSNPNGVVWGILCVNCQAGYELKTEPRPSTEDGRKRVAGLGRKVFVEPKE